MRVFLFTLALLLPSLSLAQGRLDPDAPSYFHQGDWTLDLAGGYIKDYSRGDSSLAVGLVGTNYFLKDTLALRLELVGYRASQPQDDTWAGGFDLMLRHHFFNRGDLSIFGEAGAGMIESDRSIPDDGTHFNFTLTAGLGTTYRLADHLHLLTALRYFHLSNARLHGADQNPQLNGLQLCLGLMWEL